MTQDDAKVLAAELEHNGQGIVIDAIEPNSEYTDMWKIRFHCKCERLHGVRIFATHSIHNHRGALSVMRRHRPYYESVKHLLYSM